jgi:Kef-type K+ transport system membrane component KefB
MINSFAASGGERLLFTIFVMFVAAKLAAEIFERLKQPAVAGEILAGVVIGPSVLGLVAPSELTEALSEIGVIFLLFLVGLETKPADIFRVGWRALLVAILGVAVPFIAGYLIMLAWGETRIEAIFVGAAMVATSVGITARVLGQMGLLPFFLANIGMQLKLDAILNLNTIALALGVTILAVLSKLIGCGLAALPLGKKKAFQIGMGMVPRGEVGVVVAQIGLKLNAVAAAAYGVVLFMAVATTLIAPPILVRLFRDERRVDEEPRVPVTQIS